MKLLFCPNCDSIFNLSYKEKQCECGKVKGRYINNVEAEVNGVGVSIAIGNGSLFKAIHEVDSNQDDWRNDEKWWAWWEQRPSKNMILAWTRPHSGKANPHTKEKFS